MSEGTDTKRHAKKNHKSELEREEKRSKKSKKSERQPGGGCQSLDPSATKSALSNDFALPLTGAEDQLPRMILPADTTSSMVSKTSGSGKRKRSDHKAIPDESAECHEPKKLRKPNKHQEGDLMPVGFATYPNPTVDGTLSEQSRRALCYAYERCREFEAWKFNKARQNWLLRNVWSEQAVPESYMPLVIKYMTGIKGGAREKLIGACNSKVPGSTQIVDRAQLSDRVATIDSTTIDPQPSTLRALSILSALHVKE